MLAVVPAFLVLSLLARPLSASADEVPDDRETPPAPVVEIAPLPEGAPPAATASPIEIAPRITPPGPVGSPSRLAAQLIGHVSAGKKPTTCLIVDGGRRLAVATSSDNTVSLYDTTTLDLIQAIPEVGYGAWGLAALDDRTLLVANWIGSTVAILDRDAGKRVGDIPVGMKPSYIAVSPDGKRVFAGGNFSGDVAIADIATRKLVRSLDIGRKPMGVAVSPDGRWLYVASCESLKISKVDLKHEVVLETWGVPLAKTTNLALSRDGATLLAAGDHGELLVIDTATGKDSRVKIGGELSSVALTPDGSLALVANYANSSVHLVDMSTREAYAGVSVGAGPIHVETDGERFFSCNDRANSVSAYHLVSAELAAERAAAQPADVSSRESAD